MHPRCIGTKKKKKKEKKNWSCILEVSSMIPVQYVSNMGT